MALIDHEAADLRSRPGVEGILHEGMEPAHHVVIELRDQDQMVAVLQDSVEALLDLGYWGRIAQLGRKRRDAGNIR